MGTPINFPQEGIKGINRVMVIGCCGAGKSTITLKLKNDLELPVFHLDKLFWKAGWEQKALEEFRAEHEQIIKNSHWVIDGNYASTMSERYEKADLVIFMALPRWQCLWGVIKRRLTYNKQTRPDITEGCPERFDWEFYKYVWNFHKTQLPKIEAIINTDNSKKLIYRITSRKQANEFVREFGNAK